MTVTTTAATRELASSLKDLPREVADRTEEIRRSLDREADPRDPLPEV